MRRFLTYIFCIFAIPLQLLAVAYHCANEQLPAALNLQTPAGLTTTSNKPQSSAPLRLYARTKNSQFYCPSTTATTIDGFSAIPLSSFAQYNTLAHLSSITGQYFNASFASFNGGHLTNTLINITNTVHLNRSVIWSSVGKPARIDYTLNGQFLRRWQYTFENGRVKKVTRHGGDSLKTEYTYNDKGYLTAAASSILTGATYQPCPPLTYAYEYTSGGDTAVSGCATPVTRDEHFPASDDLQSVHRWSPFFNIIGRISNNVSTVKIAYAAETNNATIAGNLFHGKIMVQSPQSQTPVAGSLTVIATPSGGGAPDISTLEFSEPARNEVPFYNNRGMILADSRRTYLWDAAGRLMRITNNGVSPELLTEFTYYADNRRATKKVSKYISNAWQHQKTLQFIWNGWKLAAEIEKNPSDAIIAVRHFVYGPDIEGQKTASLDSSAEGIGGLLLIREWKSGVGDRIYLPLSDALGNICGLIDGATGALVAEYEYSPYGQLIMESGPAIASCPLRHRTRYYDSENWLYYYGHRYYDPASTKWISKDPIGESGGWNLTAAFGNDPVNKFDATGLMTWDEFYGYHLSPEALKFKTKVFGGVVGGAGKALYGVGKGTFVITAGSVHAYFGVESYAGFEDDYLQIGEGIVSFVSHPIRTTKSGVQGWQNGITEALLSGNGYSVGSSIGNASMQGLIIGETVVNPAAHALSKASGRAGVIGATLTKPIYELPAFESLYANLVKSPINTRAAGSSIEVNPTSGNRNCVNCAIATDSKLAGHPASAMPGTPTSIAVLESRFGRSFNPVSGMMEIGQTLIKQGNGTRGIIFGASRNGNVGHVWNVVNQNGTIRFLDGQTGKVAGAASNLFDQFTDFQFLLTN